MPKEPEVEMTAEVKEAFNRGAFIPTSQGQAMVVAACPRCGAQMWAGPDEVEPKPCRPCQVWDEHNDKLDESARSPMADLVSTEAWRERALIYRAAIVKHRENVKTVGMNVDRQGNPVWGGEWDRELWSVVDL